MPHAAAMPSEPPFVTTPATTPATDLASARVLFAALQARAKAGGVALRPSGVYHVRGGLYDTAQALSDKVRPTKPLAASAKPKPISCCACCLVYSPKPNSLAARHRLCEIMAVESNSVPSQSKIISLLCANGGSVAVEMDSADG